MVDIVINEYFSMYTVDVEIHLIYILLALDRMRNVYIFIPAAADSDVNAR